MSRAAVAVAAHADAALSQTLMPVFVGNDGAARPLGASPRFKAARDGYAAALERAQAFAPAD